MATNERKVILTAREAADYLRISLFTLSRIEREGLLFPFRTPGGHRRYSLEMLNEYLESNRYPSAARHAMQETDSSSSASKPVQPEQDRPRGHSRWTLSAPPEDAEAVRRSTPHFERGKDHTEKKEI